MVLSDDDRFAVWSKFMRDYGGARLSKADLRAAVDAADDWLETSKLSFDAALPEAARLGLSAEQKQLLQSETDAKRLGATKRSKRAA